MKKTKFQQTKLVPIEEYLRPQYINELIRCVPFQWKRNPVDHRLENASRRTFLVIAFLNVCYYSFNILDILGRLFLGRPTSQNPPIFSTTVYFSVRALWLYLKRREIVDLANELDREWPKDFAGVVEMQMDQSYELFRQRFAFMSFMVHVVQPFYCFFPLFYYLLTHKSADVPVEAYETLLGGWLPFGLRQNPKYYFAVWCFDLTLTCCGLGCFVAFDSLFNAFHNLLVTHLNYLATKFAAIDPVESMANEEQFFADLKVWVQKQQIINDLCRRYNDIFKGAFLVGNFICAGSICIMLFIMTEASDFIVIIQNVQSLFVLIVFTFEICLRGSQLQEASDQLPKTLYNQLWYNGNPRYRKFFLLWLQYSQRTQKLGGYGLIEVNMVHFTDVSSLQMKIYCLLNNFTDLQIMQLSYRLFTFLKSH
ncbi:hypothetical protein KR018_010768 [Drosophila ironensis]|nr:hypothetical protein KR018_010768 [Drosophila ironensis]